MAECKLCNHKWRERTEEKPKACPNCKRYDWEDKDGTEKNKDNCC